MAALVLDRLGKIYPHNIEALRDFTLNIADGEFVVLVGPSGCGKTTTLRLVAGLETPADGTISIDGRVVNALPPRERDVAMVFQRPALYPHLSVRRNLSFGLEMRQSWHWFRGSEDRKANAARVAETARVLDLADLLDRRADALSGGQQQRVALGRALVRQPAVFLLDEPLSHLDARLRAEMRGELHLLHKRFPATMLYVTHDPVEAMTLADRVVVLDRGVVRQVDRPQAIYDRPGHRMVAGFFGWPSMNLLEGAVVRENGRLGFAAKDRLLVLPLDEAAHANGDLTLGIRPEDVELRPAETRQPNTLRIALVEPLGASDLITLEYGATRLTASTMARQRWMEGQDVNVTFDTNRTHWFDARSGLALRREGRIA